MPWRPNYADVSALSDYQNLVDDRDDAALARDVESASRAVDRFCFRQFGRTDEPEARYYTPEWVPSERAWVIETDDMVGAPTELAVDTAGDGTYSTAALPSAVRPLPANADTEGRPWERLRVYGASGLGLVGRRLEIRVTAVWGWASVPVSVVEATLLQANRLASRRFSPYGVAGSPDAGSEIRLLSRLDPDVQVVLRPFRRLGRVG